MTTTALFILLSLTVALVGSICEPSMGARTPAQIGATVRHSAWRQRIWWLLCVIACGIGCAIGYAIRSAFYFLAVWVAKGAAKAATFSAMDGRSYQVLRATGGRA